MRARLITQRDLIRGVAEQWRINYNDYIKDNEAVGHVSSNTRVSARVTYNKLCALDVEKATSQDVAEIIGNDGWTNLKCDGCQKERHERIVQVGDKDDYDSRTVNLCPACVIDAYSLLLISKTVVYDQTL